MSQQVHFRRLLVTYRVVLYRHACQHGYCCWLKNSLCGNNFKSVCMSINSACNNQSILVRRMCSRTWEGKLFGLMMGASAKNIPCTGTNKLHHIVERVVQLSYVTFTSLLWWWVCLNHPDSMHVVLQSICMGSDNGHL